MKTKSDTAARKLIDRLVPEESWGALRGFLATTYELQPDFVDTDFLPSLFGLGAWDDRSWTSRIAIEKRLAELDTATIFMEARKYRGRPRSLRLEVVGVAERTKLHSKALLLVYEKAVRLLITSANLTEPGYRRNREVVTVLSADLASGSPPLLEAIRGLEEQLSRWLTKGARDLLALARQRLATFNAVSNDPLQPEVVWSGGPARLSKLFLDRWAAAETIEHLTVVSPFWSEDAGMLRRFLTELGDRANRPAEVRLLTEAAAPSGSDYAPVLPASYATSDWLAHGTHVYAQAVDPRVLEEEVGGLEEFGGLRRLHAKVVVLRGPTTALVYVGSANFTGSGWGMIPAHLPANLEAGMILRVKARGAILSQVLPPTIGTPVLLESGTMDLLAIPEPMADEAPWPDFLHEVYLAPSLTNTMTLELVFHVGPSEGEWSAELSATSAQTECLIQRTSVEKSFIRVRLAPEALERLLAEQELLVRWAKCPSGRLVPINVDAEARLYLPIAPGSGELGESELIAFYQGRIPWEELFPEPASAEEGEPTESANQDSLVDKSRIQTYQVREFVEALAGICPDLLRSAISPQAIRLAFLGSVSPVALAQSVVSAPNRTPMAKAFQLVELLTCMEKLTRHQVLPELTASWNDCIKEARQRMRTQLANLMKDKPAELGGKAFRSYRKTILGAAS